MKPKSQSQNLKQTEEAPIRPQANSPSKKYGTLKLPKKSTQSNVSRYCSKENRDRMNKELQLLAAIENLSLEDRPVRIITGFYESGGTNPQKIQDDWQLLHNKLRNLCFDSFKRIKHQHQDSTAFTEYKELTKNPYLIPDVKRLPRIETTIVVRKISIILMRTLGLLNLAKDADISFTIASKMPEDGDGISENIWRKLPRLNLGTTFDVEHVFNTLIRYGDYGEKCAKFWNSERKIMEHLLEKYGVISENIPDIASRLIYACIYIKLQMQSIGGADIAGYILGMAGDYLDFCPDDCKPTVPDHHDRLSFDEAYFDNDFETDSAEGYTESPTPLFNIFPGIGYRSSVGFRVISKCKIAT